MIFQSCVRLSKLCNAIANVLKRAYVENRLDPIRLNKHCYLTEYLSIIGRGFGRDFSLPRLWAARNDGWLVGAWNR